MPALQQQHRLGCRRSGLRIAVGAILAGLAAVAVVGAPALAASDRLTPGQRLSDGESLTSKNGQHQLHLGDLVTSNGVFIIGPSCETRTIKELDPMPKASSLVMQPDGNLVLYADGKARWSTRTAGKAVAGAVMQSDQNLVVYGKDGRALWASATACSNDHNTDAFIGDLYTTQFGPGQFMQSPDRRFRLMMQSDGNLVLQSATRAVWSTRTQGNPGALLRHQTDNNLVIYAKNGKVLWSSGTATADSWQHPTTLSLGNNGSLVLNQEGKGTIWSAR